MYQGSAYLVRLMLLIMNKEWTNESIRALRISSGLCSSLINEWMSESINNNKIQFKEKDNYWGIRLFIFSFFVHISKRRGGEYICCFSVLYYEETEKVASFLLIFIRAIWININMLSHLVRSCVQKEPNHLQMALVAGEGQSRLLKLKKFRAMYMVDFQMIVAVPEIKKIFLSCPEVFWKNKSYYMTIIY